VHTVLDLGPRTIGHVVSNTMRRRRAAAAETAARHPGGPASPPGALAEVHDEPGGAHLVFESAVLDVEFLDQDVVRLSWGPATEPVPYALSGGLSPPPPPVNLRRLADGGCALSSSALEVAVSGAGALTVSRADGTVLRHLEPPLRRGATWEQRFDTRGGERFSGLGEQAGSVDLSGGRYRLWNSDPGGAWGPGRQPLYLGIPVVIGRHSDGDVLSFFENPAYAVFGFPPSARPGQASVSFAGGMLRHYLMVGDTARLLERYTALTGRPALPPRWALGYHQSRWGYKNEGDVTEVLDGFASMGVPLSAVHLDIDYMDGYRVFTVNRRRFPDLAGLSRRAGRGGVRLVTIIDPAVKVDDRFALYRQGEADGRFCRGPDGATEVGVVWPGRAAFPDFTDPATRSWWSDQYRTLTDAGVAGIWHDMNEPTSIALAGDPTLPLATRHDLDGRGGDHGEAHNLYGLLMNRAGHEGLARARPEWRPWVVSRSGWAGVQRWAWNWTGDVETSWDGLRQQVATVIGLGLSGVAYSGPDIGGFSGVPNDELYLRWLQMAVFLPFCRTHSVVGAPPREPWRFRPPTRAVVAAWIRMRYRLLPYLYTLAHQATVDGAPLVRPVWWPSGEAPSGEAGDLAAGEDDTFLLGPALVVAPVTAPGSLARSVTMPPGRWRSLWAADDAIERAYGSVAELSAPMGRIPVMVRSGVVLPLDDGWAEYGGPCAVHGDHAGLGHGTASEGPVALDHAPRLLGLHCIVGADGSATGTVVDDAGDGDGPVRHDRFEFEADVEARSGAIYSAVLRWHRHGAYPPPQRVRVVVHGAAALRAEADGRQVPVEAGAVLCAPFDEMRMVMSPTGPTTRP